MRKLRHPHSNRNYLARPTATSKILKKGKEQQKNSPGCYDEAISFRFRPLWASRQRWRKKKSVTFLLQTLIYSLLSFSLRSLTVSSIYGFSCTLAKRRGRSAKRGYYINGYFPFYESSFRLELVVADSKTQSGCSIHTFYRG